MSATIEGYTEDQILAGFSSTYGFSTTFQNLVKTGFLERGSYQGDFYTFYGELPPDER